MEKLSQIKENLQNAMKAAKESCQKLFQEECKVIFDQFPELESFGFVGYTPYFNDGDACEYSVRCDLDYGLRINGKDFDNTAEDAGFSYGDDGYDKLEEEWKKYQPISDLVYAMDSVPGDLLKQIFDDHSEVTIHRDGKIEVEEYEHD